MKKILIIDDDLNFIKSLKRLLLTIDNFDIHYVVDATAFISSLTSESFDLLFIDLNMPVQNGRECLTLAKKMFPKLPAIIISGEKDADTALECMRNGAQDYITKPVDPIRLNATVSNVFRVSSLERELVSITKHLMDEQISSPEDFSRIITSHPSMLMNFKYIEAISRSDNPIIICGETGTGKELFAEAIHKNSRFKGPFVAVDVSGLDDNVFSDTLFGHTKGAFTGADKPRPGLVEKAAGGTLFLDEIGDLQEASQIKLLRLLQTRMYYPLGSDTQKKSTARIVAAVNRPIEQLMSSSFREDLYYRLSTHRIDIPPLRERKKDIRLLAKHFYTSACEQYAIQGSLPEEALEMLEGYSFPGNVRELKSIIDDAVLQQKIGLGVSGVIKRKVSGSQQKAQRGSIKDVFGYFPTLTQATDQLVLEALSEAGGSQKDAARLIGISRQAFNRRLNLINKR
jgi:DNA-binding NtrC family response regulator